MRFFVLLIGCLLALPVQAQDWPQFRGPDGNGHAPSNKLPLNWSETENVTWKTAIPGEGHSSPVVVGNQVWVTAAIRTAMSQEEVDEVLKTVPNAQGIQVAGHLSLRVLCLNRETGEVIYDIEAFSVDKPGPVHELNSYASPTPVARDGKLYCHFGTYGNACINVDSGEIVWKNDSLHIDHQTGPGSSPMLWQDLLIVNYDGIDSQFVVALDIHGGQLVWKTDRSGKLPEREPFRKAYTTPVVAETKSGPRLISAGADWVYAYNPADGEEIWKASYGELGFSTVPKPVVGHGLVYVCTSFMKSRLLALRYDGKGDVSDSHVEWQSDSQISKKPSLLLLGDRLYCGNDAGILTCFSAKTGDELWRSRIEGNYSASPIVSGDRLYFFSHEGKAVVVRDGAKFEELAENHLDAGFMASPAASGDSLFLRTETHLYRIDE